MEESTVNSPFPALDWRVAEVISRCPDAGAVFMQLRMACVGCAMAPFETLAEAVAAYHLEPDQILHKFREVLDRRAGEAT